MAFSESQEEFERVEKYREFIDLYYRDELGQLIQHYPNEQQSLEVEWRDLFQFDADLTEDYREDPEGHGELLDEALASVDHPVDVDLSDASVRVHAPNDDVHTFSVGETRSQHVGEYLALKGQISKTTKVQPKAIEAAFQCQRCNTMTHIPTINNEVSAPAECHACERQGPFRFVEGQSEFVDHQLLRLQQPPEEVQGGQGRHIDVHVEGKDIVADLQAGDRVTISGTVEIGEFEDDAIMDTHFSGQAARVEQTDYEDIDIEEHRDRIEALAAGEEGDPFELLMQSIAPKIHGHSSLKLAVILQLFGGVRVEHGVGAADRGDSHILLLGDPGTSKSQLLQAVKNLAPRSALASGKGATAAGLTAAAVSDDFGDTQWSLDAGAMAKAHKGIACLDEIDKIHEEAVSSLHEALEQQEINVNKAGINTTLPAQTAVLAAGNPKYGRFDEFKSMADQVDIAPTLLSRFDLIFFVRDEPDPEKDKVIGNHVIDYHQQGITANESGGTPDDYEPDVSTEVIRAWIAHAKRTTTPKMPDPDVREKLVTAFNELRQANDDDDDGPVPVTFRKLEAIQRIAEASARVRLSDIVEMQDVNRACELVGESMRQVGVDPETEKYDADIVETGTSQTQHDRIETLRSIISEIVDDPDVGNVGAPAEEVRESAVATGISESKVKHTIEKLKDKGEVYEPEEGELLLVK